MPRQPIILARFFFPITLEQAILDAIRALPADKQREPLDHVKHLRDEATQAWKPRNNRRGLWADLNIDLSAEMIDDAQWGNVEDFRQGRLLTPSVVAYAHAIASGRVVYSDGSTRAHTTGYRCPLAGTLLS
jgi:hypothetical protein